MSIYLDSALPEEARQAMSLGFVRGITTNPTLLARAKRPAPEVLRELCHICSGTVFYQLTAPTVAERRAEGKQVLRLNDEFDEEKDRHFAKWMNGPMEEKFVPLQLGRIGLKISASIENMALVAEFSDKGVTVAVTALFNPAQAYLACEAGAKYLLPYVNRTTRLRGDGLRFVKELAQICKAVGHGTEILAASIKSPEEAVKTLLAGAHHISVPLAILLAMGHDPLSDEAVAEFAKSST